MNRSMYAFVYPILIALYLISIFAHIPIMNYVVGAVAVFALLLSSIFAKGLYFYTGLVFLLSGVYLFIYNGVPWQQFLLQFQSMLGLLSFFMVLPFINTIIYIERFDKTIESFLKQKISYWDQLYKRSTFANQLIANFLNVAAIPLIARALKPSLGGFPKSKKHSFSSKMILRSYALALTWSPLDATVTSSIDFTGVNYLIVAPIMLCIAIAAIYTDIGISFLRYRKINFTPTIGLNSAGTAIKTKLIKLGLFIAIFVALASLVHSALHQSFLISIVIVLPGFSLIWSMIFRKPKRYISLIAGNWNNHTRGLSKYFFMFLSAGLFVKMAAASGAIELLQNFYEQFVNVPVYFYLLTAAFFLITSLVGFHPLVALAVFAASLEPVIAELSVVPFTVVLIACSIASVMYSPFNLSVSVLANELKINPYRITSWNLGFAILYVGFSITVAIVLDLVI